jgi:hypothetical protein
MLICKVCSTENADDYIYCKNCGNLIRNEGVKEPKKPTTAISLVPVVMMLPNPDNPYENIPQTVYVTPAQKAAIEAVTIKK